VRTTRDQRGRERHERGDHRGVRGRRPLEREREQDRPAEDGAEHRQEKRPQLVAQRPRHAAPREQNDGKRARDRSAARRRQERVEPHDCDLRQRHREREEHDAEQRPCHAFAPPSHARK